MSVFDAVLAQYEKSKSTAIGNNNKMTSEERLKKFFTTVLPKGSKGEERRIRILPTKDGSSPFVEVYFHEIQVDGKWVKLYDPAQEGKRSPLNEVREGLQMMGDEQSKELAKNYRSRKFFIVKVIDRDHEQDGPKFWRFKHNTKQEGIFDKIFPIFRNKGDITDPTKGRDLILSLSLTKSGTGKEYTVINSILNEDPSPLSEDASLAQSWIEDPMVWSDVYAKKGEDYLELVAKGEVPKWDDNLKKFVSSSTSDETIAEPKSSAPLADPQEDADVDDDLPF
jgi:gp32 DNA binding protein like